MAKDSDDINLLKNPIKHDGIVSMDIFYNKLNYAVKRLYSDEAEESGRYFISLCRAAIGGLAWNNDYKSIRSVINYYRIFLGEVVDVCDFKSTRDFNILDMPESDMPRVTEILSDICFEPEPATLVRNKYPKSPYPNGGLHGVSDFYRANYGAADAA